MPAVGQGPEDRLDSWKEIAAYLGRTVRTVHRWEQSDGLPVYRCGGTRASIYAYRSEIDEWLKAGKAVRDDADDTPARSGLWRRLRIPVFSAVLLLAIAGGWRWSVLGRRETPVHKILPLTTYPGAESQPALSWDGSRIAFVWNGPSQDNFDIYTRLVDGGSVVRLTSHPAAETNPVFSADGRRIAFRRGLGIWVISALGGDERRIASVTKFLPPSGFAKLSWSADGKWVAYADKDPADQPSGIFLVEVATGERRRVTTPPFSDSVRWGDNQPAFSFDGRMLAFVRGRGQSSAAIFTVSLSAAGVPAGEPSRLTPDGAAPLGLVWAPDNRAIFSCGPDGIMRVPLGRPRTPELVIGDVRTGLTIAPLAARAAFVEPTFDTNIWRIAAMSEAPPKRVIASTEGDFAPEYSPDGSQIVFTSTRSGRHELWRCDSDGSNPVQMTFYAGPIVGVARWSPDGRRIVFVSQARGRVGVYLIPATGGKPTLFAGGPSDNTSPAWSRDGRWIYFGSNRSGDYQIWRAPADGGDATQITRGGGHLLNTSRDGQSIYYVKPNQTGLWRVPCAGGEETRVLEQGRHLDWELSNTGIYLLNRQVHRLEFYPFGASHPSRTVSLPAGTHLGLMASRQMAISPDDRWILYTQVDREESDLKLVENFR